MFYLLQYEDNNYKSIESYLVKSLIDERKRIHDCLCINYDELDSIIEDKSLPVEEMIAIGSLKFVRKFLLEVHGVERMNCIEVPPILRKEKYLKRGYSVLSKEELPSSGYYFLKYASELKDYTYRGRIEFLPKEDLGNGEPYIKDGQYVLSEMVSILSEYRCFVMDDKIDAIQFYDGDCMIMPSKEDLELLREMVNVYRLDNDRPKAYTLDFAIIEDRGLAILEIHPHACVGLYGYSNPDMLYSYAYGQDWYISKNIELRNSTRMKVTYILDGCLELDGVYNTLEEASKRKQQIYDNFKDDGGLSDVFIEEV